MKTKKQIDSERTKRRADIRRGMRIAIYEVKQALAAQGVAMDLPAWFIPYTVAIAEAGRRGATFEDRAAAAYWKRISALSVLFERRRRVVVLDVDSIRAFS